MKTLAILFLFGTFLFSSCKKDRTCICYYTSPAGVPSAWQNIEPDIITVKATKRDAKEKCDALDSKPMQSTSSVTYIPRDCSYQK
jgi:hypothetical protein